MGHNNGNDSGSCTKAVLNLVQMYYCTGTNSVSTHRTSTDSVSTHLAICPLRAQKLILVF